MRHAVGVTPRELMKIMPSILERPYRSYLIDTANGIIYRTALSLNGITVLGELPEKTTELSELVIVVDYEDNGRLEIYLW